MSTPKDNIITIDTELPESSSYREVPYNIEAEQIVLGAVLTNNEALNRIADFLRDDCFYEPVHRDIYSAIEQMNDKGLIASPVTLKNRFDKHEALSDVGGANYLAKLAGLASGIVNIKEYALIIYNLSISRQLIDIGEDMVNNAYSSSGEERASSQIEYSEQKLFNLASEGSSDSNFENIKLSVTKAIEMADHASKRDGAISGIPTKFLDLDELLGGLHNSDLIILAARPSMGKTALALNVALNAAQWLKQDHTEKMKQYEASLGGNNNTPEPAPMGAVGFISLEMSADQLSTRLLSMESAINAINIRRGKLSPDDFENLVRASNTLHQLPIYIDDTPAQTIAAVRTRARRLKRKHNLALLVVDYLQLLRGVSKHSQQSRVQEISEITMGLKAIAKELDIPVLALSQLSRAVESRDDKRPQLSDLRESGSIEQDADLVLFIYREAYYLERKRPAIPNYPDNPSPENIAAHQAALEILGAWEESEVGQRFKEIQNRTEIIVSKHRHGPIGNVTLVFDHSTTKFKNFYSDNTGH